MSSRLGPQGKVLWTDRWREFSRSLSLRLNLWYAAIFTGSALLLFVLIYYLLGATIDQKDSDVIRARLREYQTVYEQGGVQALKDWIYRVDEATRQQTFFVRVSNTKQMLMLMIVPKNWVASDIKKIEGEKPIQPGSWLRVPRDEDVDIIVASTFTHDGTFIQVGRSSDSRSKMLEKLRFVFAIIIIPVIGLGFAGGLWMAGRITRPIRQMVAVVRSIISTSQMNVRVPTQKTHDELQDLAELFNRMLAGHESLLASLRESLDNVAHDLRTPLSRLRFTLENVLRKDSDLVTSRRAIADALEEADRVQTIIRTLMDVAQAEAGMMKLELAEADLGSLVDDVIELYENVASEKEILVEKRFAEGFRITMDSARIRQVFANLLDNALKYTPEKGNVLIGAREEAGRVVISFRDSGVGISERDLPHIWERLYRGDKSRNEHGLGLGLSLVKAIVQAHGGQVGVTSTPQEGSEFRVYLPVKKEPVLNHSS